MTAPTLSTGNIDLIMQLGRRRKGITVPEVSERFHCSHLAAWRALQRLEKAGRLHRTGNKRSRSFYGGGRSPDVYKTREAIRKEEERCQEEDS